MKKHYAKIILIFFLLLIKGVNVYAACSGTIAFTVPTGVCAGSVATFTNTTTIADTCIWKWGDLSANTVVNNTSSQSHTYTNAGTYTVWLIKRITSPACRDSVSHTITISPLPTASFTVVNPGVCSLTPIQFTNTSSGTGLTYSWAFGDGTTSTAISPSHQFDAYGDGGNQTFSVTLTATNSSGCSASVTNSVSVINRPDASLAFAGGINSDCNSGSSPFTLSVFNNSLFTTNVTNYNINWGDGSANLSNNTFLPLTTTTHAYTNLGYSNIVFTLTSSTGCNDTANYQFFKGSNPSVGLAILGGTVGCLPQAYTFNVTNVSANTPGTTYTVAVNDNSASIAYTQSSIPSSVSHVFNVTSCGANAGTFTNAFKIEIVATNPCGSSSAEVKPIVISEKPEASFTMSPTPNACTNQIVTFTNTSIPPNSANYVSNNYVCNSNTDAFWSITPATGWTLSSGSTGVPGFIPGSNIIGVQFTQAGNYNIKLTVSGNTSVCGNDTISQNICITNPIVPAFTISNTNGCAPLNITTNNTTPQPTCGTNTYSWAVTYSATSLCDNVSAFTFTSGTTASSTSPSFQFTNAGTYTITLSVTNVCGTLTTTRTVVVKKKPLATVSPISGSCILPYIINPTLTDTNCAANALTYSWTFGGGIPATSTSASPTNISFATTGNHIVTANVTNECGTTTSTTNFTIVPNTPVTVSPASVSICAGASTTLTASNASNYSWSPAAGLSATTGNTVTANPTTTTTYTITGTSGTCTSTAQVTVTVNPLPTITISPSSSTICIGQNVTLTANGANTYSWLPTAGLNVANVASVTANPIITTLYSVTGTSTNGCSSTQTVNVTVNPLPTVNAGATPQQFCNTNTPIQLTGFSPAGGLWSGTGVTSTGSFNPATAGVGPTTLTYTFTDPNGCVNSSTITANVTSPQVADAGNGFSICTNASQVALTGFTPAGGTWSGSGISGDNFNPSSASIGTNILTYSIGAASCLSTDTIQVIVNPLPTITISPSSSTICVGQSVTLTASGANTYSWLPTTGLNVANVASVTANPIITTLYTATGISTNGCSSTQTINVAVNPLPTVNAGATPQQFCNTNTPIQLTGFSPAGGLWSGTGVASTGSFNPATAGVGPTTLTYTFTDANGCVNSSTITANVTSPQVADAGNGFSICTNASQVALTGFTPAGGTWSGSGISGDNFNPSGASIGTNILTYSIGAASCLSTDTIQVIVNPLPTITISPSSSTICVGQSVTLTASGANTYSWLPTAGLNVANVASVTANPIITTLYIATGISTNGCSSTQTINVAVNPLPTVNAGLDIPFCNTNSTNQLTGFIPGGGTWSGNGVTALGVFNPSIAGNGIWDLVYTYTDVNGCSNSDTLKATVTSPTNANAGDGFSICKNTLDTLLSGATPPGGIWSGTGVVGSSFSATIAPVGNHILTYSTGTGSCLTTDTLNINVVALPAVSVTANPTTICYGLSTILNASGASTYSWLPNIGLSSSIGASVNAIPLNSSYYFVEGTDSYGCKNKDSVYINVNPLPIVNAGADEQYCNQNIPIQFSGFSPLNGVWSGIGISAGGLYTPSVGGVGIFDLIYTFTDGNGCINSDTISSTVINPTQANAGLDTAICQSLATVNFAGLPSGGVWSGLHISPTGIFTPDSAGNYTITYTFGSGTCQTSDTKNIIVHALPPVNVGPDIDVCASAPPITLTTNIAGGTWQGTGIIKSANGIFNPTLIAAGTSSSIVYQVASTSTGCINTDSLILNVRPLPLVLFDSLPLGCANTPIQFINNTIGDNTFLWSFGDGSNSSLIQANHIYTTNDTFTVRLIATSNFGCIDSAQHQMIITVPPVSNFFDNQTTICGNQLISFTNTSFAQFSTFSWNFDNGIISNLETPPPITFQLYAAADTNYYVTLTVDNICGTSSYVDTIRLIAYPTADFAYFPEVVCAGNPISFSNASFGYGNSYQWFINGNLVSTNTILPNQTFTASLIDSVYVVKLVSTNFCGTTSRTDSITVYPATVTAFFTVDSSFSCLGQTVNFINSVASYHYIVWKYGDGINSIDTIPYHNYLTPGTYTVWQIVYGYCGIDSISRNVTVSPNPMPDFSFVNPICGKDTAVFTNLTLGNNNFYSWNFGDGQSASDYSTSHHYFLPNNLTSTYIVKLIVTDAATLCKDSLSSPITVLTNPIANFSILDNEVCLGSPIVANAVQSSGLNYVWSISNGETIVGNQMNFLFTDTGQYSFNLNVNDNFQCNDDTTYNFVFVRPNALANFSTTQQPPCAYNSNLLFTNGSTLSNSYLWDFGINGNSNFQTPSPINFNEPSTFDATLIANNIYNCPDTITKPIEIVIKPKAIFAAPDSVCQKQEFQLQNNSINSTIFEWATNGFIFSNQSSPFYESNNIGNLNLQLIATSNYDATCMDTAYKSVKVNGIPSATFNSYSIDTVIDGTSFTPCGGYFMFVPDFNKNDILYNWNLANNLISTTVKPKAFYELNGDYEIELQVENRFGCTNKTDTIININCDGNIVLPNALAPSSNDTSLAWFIPKGKYIEKLKIEIFSPWGERVWYTDKLDEEGSPTEHWDGTYNNQLLPQGAFLVKVNAIFSSKPAFIKTFYITLIR
jgi:PKD repeat protein